MQGEKSAITCMHKHTASTWCQQWGCFGTAGVSLLHELDRLVLRKTETLSTTKLAIFHILFQEPQNKGKPSLLSKREGGKGRERNRKVNVEDWDVIRTLTTLNPFTIRPDMSLLYIALIRFQQVGIVYFKVNFAVGCENEDRGNILINESQKNVDIAVNLRIRLREKSFFHLV